MVARNDVRLRQIMSVLGAFNDHSRFCRDTLTIPNESGLVVPVVERPGQARLTAAVAKQQKLGLPVRIRVLKARKVNMSVGAATHIFRNVAFMSGRKAKVYAHLDETIEEFYRWYEHWDSTYAGPFQKLRKVRAPFGDLIEFENDSRIEFGSAENRRSGRGPLYHWLHLSEGAFWGGGGTEIRKGLLNTVPFLPETGIIDESTANGMSGAFYEGWKRSIENPDDGWLCEFFAWWEHPLYRLPVTDPSKFEKSLTNEEHALRQSYNLTLEQLRWRRVCIRTQCDGDERVFQQEYPSCWQEAFLTSGRPRFDMRAIAAMPSLKFATGELERVRIGPDTKLQFVARGDELGRVRILRMPEPGRMYSIGVDSAQGKDANEGKGTADPDYSAAEVLDVMTGEQVAYLKGRMEANEFAALVNALGEFFNWSFLTIEANTQGFGPVVINELLHLNYPLDLMYARERTPDDRSPTPLHKIGYLTAGDNRGPLIARLASAIIAKTVMVYDAGTKAELETFVYWPNGKPAAQRGAHDDEVIALALAEEGREQAATIHEARKRYRNRRPEQETHAYSTPQFPERRRDDEDDDDDSKPRTYGYGA